MKKSANITNKTNVAEKVAYMEEQVTSFKSENEKLQNEKKTHSLRYQKKIKIVILKKKHEIIESQLAAIKIEMQVMEFLKIELK